MPAGSLNQSLLGTSHAVIPVLLGFLFSSLAHAGKYDTSVRMNKTRLSWKGGIQCKHSSEPNPLYRLESSQGFGNAGGFLHL